MENTQKLTHDYSLLLWGIFFAWWGITELPGFLPHGAFALGIGLILLGLNVFRLLNGLPTKSLSVTLGILALTLGSLELMRSIIPLPFELPIFAILLLIFGILILGHELLHLKQQR